MSVAAARPGNNNYFTKMRSGSEAGSYLRRIQFSSLNSRLESNEEEEETHTQLCWPHFLLKSCRFVSYFPKNACPAPSGDSQ
jgi:hypothetical protein